MKFRIVADRGEGSRFVIEGEWPETDSRFWYHLGQFQGAVGPPPGSNWREIYAEFGGDAPEVEESA